MKNIKYSIFAILFAVIIVSCERNEIPVEEELVAIELVAAEESVEVSRAANMNLIDNATILVFDAAGTTVLYRKNVNHNSGGRLYIKKGTGYQIFAVANLADANCPGAYTAANYLNDVTQVSDLNSKYLIATTSTPDKIIMCSNLVTGVDVTSANFTTPIQIELKRVQTKIDLHVYNKTSGGGSGVTLHSYYTNNLPLGSWLRGRAGSSPNPSTGDYAGGYSTTKGSPVLFSTLTPTTDKPGYAHYTIEIITFENRRGNGTTAITNVYDRKKYAPANALEITIAGYDAAAGTMLNTYVHPGKGRTPENAGPDNINNFDLDRNCIYHVNVYIESTTNITYDSRREHLELKVCGDLESPTNGTGADW